MIIFVHTMIRETKASFDKAKHVLSLYILRAVPERGRMDQRGMPSGRVAKRVGVDRTEENREWKREKSTRLPESGSARHSERRRGERMSGEEGEIAGGDGTRKVQRRGREGRRW